MAGLVAGLALTPLRTRVVGVRVYDRLIANERVVAFLADRTLATLRRLGARVQPRRAARADFEVLDGFFGRGYARHTRAGAVAAALFADTEGLVVDGTYSAKAAAALLDLATRAAGRGGPLLFLATYNSRPLEPLLAGAPRPADLPAPLRRYFTEPVAPVDEA
jgi:D-cysteine desulfhydrase